MECRTCKDDIEHTTRVAQESTLVIGDKVSWSQEDNVYGGTLTYHGWVVDLKDPGPIGHRWVLVERVGGGGSREWMFGSKLDIG